MWVIDISTVQKEEEVFIYLYIPFKNAVESDHTVNFSLNTPYENLKPSVS